MRESFFLVEKASRSEFEETKTEVKRKVMTTKGWDFHVHWEHGETSYIALKDIQETNPIEIAEYVDVL